MKIDLNNYPVYIIDFYDGTLDKVGERELFDFLEEHPHLKEEFDSFADEPLSSIPEKIIFKNKDSLKNIPQEIDHLLISALEGDLSVKEEKKFRELMENDSLRKEYNQFAYTKSKPDLTITFPKKKKLKKVPIINIAFSSLAIAASIALLFIFFKPTQTEKEPSFAITNNPTKVVTEQPIAQAPIKRFHHSVIIKKSPNSIITDSIIIVREDLALIEPINLPINEIKPSEIHEEFASVPLMKDAKEQQPLLGSFIKTVAFEQVNKIIPKETTGTFFKKKHRKLIDYAQLAVNGFGNVTGANVSLNTAGDKNGNQVATFKAGAFEFSKVFASR